MVVDPDPSRERIDHFVWRRPGFILGRERVVANDWCCRTSRHVVVNAHCEQELAFADRWRSRAVAECSVHSHARVVEDTAIGKPAIAERKLTDVAGSGVNAYPRGSFCSSHSIEPLPVWAKNDTWKRDLEPGAGPARRCVTAPSDSPRPL